MATTTSITTTYAGEKAAGFISAALLSSNTIEQGGLEVKPNIKFKQVLRKLSTGDLIADGSCDFDATSSVTLTERTIEPKEFQVNLQLCKQDFRSDWDAISMGYSAYDNLPPSFQEWLISYVLGKVSAKNETNLWVFVNRKVHITLSHNTITSKLSQRSTDSLFDIFLQGRSHFNVVSRYNQGDACFIHCGHLKGNATMIITSIDGKGRS